MDETNEEMIEAFIARIPAIIAHNMYQTYDGSCELNHDCIVCAEELRLIT